MSGSTNEAGQILGATAVTVGGTAVLANTGVNVAVTALIGVAIIAAVAVLASAATKRIIIRK